MFLIDDIMLAAFAETAAAEAAAATAAEVAAAEAAQIAAAEAAAQTAAQAAAQQAAAQQATQAGIMEVGGATANAPLTAEAVQSAAMNSGLPPGFEQQLQNVQNLSQGPSVQVASTNPTAGLESLKNVTTSPVSGIEQVPGFDGATAGPQGASPGFFNPSAAPGQGPLQYQLNAPNASQGLRLGSSLESSLTTPGPINSVLQPPSALETGMDKALKFAEKNPFMAMTGAYMGANMLGLMDPSGATFNQEKYDGPLSKYKLSPNFQGRTANPLDFQYKGYAGGGGIMGAESYDIPVGYNEGGDMPEYAKGGSLSESISQYQKMLDGKPQAAPARSADVGIYYDQDPDTRYQDALTAAQIRQAKVNQRAYVSPPAAKRPTPLGKLNMPTSAKSKGGGDVEAAQGGIMQSSLGGYAAGGNPRLLKGPGDGMSDNIPATINGRQPARLADGEFVIPADVVSHLGNGSTEAGAKHLHAMMDKVRKARTGNPKQGKQINPKKYMPK
jgi:hypothetical protein